MKSLFKISLLLSSVLVTSICFSQALTNFSATCTNGYYVIKLASIKDLNQVKVLSMPKDRISVYTSSSLNVDSDYISFLGTNQNQHQLKYQLERKTGRFSILSLYPNSQPTIINCEKSNDYLSILNEIKDHESQIRNSNAIENQRKEEEERARNSRPNKF